MPTANNLLRRATSAFLLLSAIAGCTSDTTTTDDSQVLDEGDIVAVWNPTMDAKTDELVTRLKTSDTFQRIAATLNTALKLPEDLPIIHRPCTTATERDISPFYDPNKHEVVLCYEMLNFIQRAMFDPKRSATLNDEDTFGAWRFMFFHELGHALIDYYGLPVTGKEEDAVDDFSIVVLLDSGLANEAASAAQFWKKLSDQPGRMADFADEHSVDAQRFFSILCLVHGSDPQRFKDLVGEGPNLLPQDRAVRCPKEFADKSSTWRRLLKAWYKNDGGLGTLGKPD